MKISFHTKFKDKIHIVDIRGLKHALETQPNQVEMNPNEVRANKKINKIPGINKKSEFKRSYTDTSQTQKNRKKKGSKQITEYSGQKQDLSYSQKHQRQKSRLKYALSSKKQGELYELKKATFNRNPEVENLVYKLREEQKQKYEKNTGPKYIDEMIIKHENLFRMLDQKRQRKEIISTTKDIQKFQKQHNHHRVPQQLCQMQSSLINQDRVEPKMGLSEPNSPTHVKLKKIQQIIKQTHDNRLKQKQRSQRQKSEVSRNSQYSFLNDNRIQSKIIKGNSQKYSSKGAWSYQNSLRTYEPSGLDTLDSVHSININSNGNYIPAGKKRNMDENPLSPFPKIKKPWTNIYSK